jgi:carnitine-CoA ligase
MVGDALEHGNLTDTALAALAIVHRVDTLIDQHLQNALTGRNNEGQAGALQHDFDCGIFWHYPLCAGMTFDDSQVELSTGYQPEYFKLKVTRRQRLPAIAARKENSRMSVFASMAPGAPPGQSLPELFAALDRTLPKMLARQAERYGPRRLVTIGGDSLTYAETAQAAAGYGAALATAGVKPGDRVAIMCGNRVELLLTILGCGWLGAIAVPINTASRGAQLEHILGNCGARLMIVERELTSVLAPLDRARVPLETLWLVGEGPTPGLERFVSAPFPAPQQVVPPHPVAPGDTFAILYTSGTTGLSKGVCCPHAQYFWWAFYTGELLGVHENDVLMTTLPMFHTNALNAFFQALLNGATLIVEPRFSASGFMAALAAHNATITYVLGAMVPMLLAQPPGAADRAHKVRLALAPAVPAHFHAQFTERFGFGLLDGYGSTETNCIMGAPLAEQRPGLMGRLLAGFSARVADANDNEVADGEAGELLLRADEPFAFATGYFGMPERTVEAWRNLWFHTGDRVVRESDGFYRFIDRMKDAIRRRGENISSYEVEQVLVSHPLIENAAVFPVRSELAEDEVMAAVVLRPEAQLSHAALLDYCQPRMPYFAVPRYLEFVDTLPATENGKVTKYKLRERGVTAATWDREKAGYKVLRKV